MYLLQRKLPSIGRGALLPCSSIGHIPPLSAGLRIQRPTRPLDTAPCPWPGWGGHHMGAMAQRGVLQQPSFHQMLHKQSKEKDIATPNENAKKSRPNNGKDPDLITKLLKDRPTDPLPFIAEWCKSKPASAIATGSAAAPTAASAAPKAATAAPLSTAAFDLKTRAVVAQKAPYAVDVKSGEVKFWCSCGMTKTQPFCDGSHVQANNGAIPFAPMKYEAKKDETVYFCGCKKSNNPPLCDGAHTKLPDGPAAISTVAYDIKTRAIIPQKAPYAVDVKTGETKFWCTCGHSKKQPFCDGSHIQANKDAGLFAPMKFVATKNETLYFCGCRQTNTPPFCDGAHSKLTSGAAPAGGSATTTSSASAPKTFSLAELARHTKKEDCWIMVDNKIYDVTKWLSSHPAGPDIILMSAGKDASAEFNGMHSDTAKAMLKDYYIGDLEGASGGNAATASRKPSETPGPMSANDYRPFALVETKPAGPTAKYFRFALSSPAETLQMPICSHISIRVQDPTTGKEVMRSYTPVETAPGSFEMVVRLYPNGIGSGFIHHLPIGGKMFVRGPLPGKFNFTPNQYTDIGMLAGGTGIAPIYQVIKGIVQDAQCKTKAWLLFASRSEDDILLPEKLDKFAKEHPDKFAQFHILGKPAKDTTKFPHTGHVTAELLQKLMPLAVKPSTHYLICGPPPFNEACVKIMATLGFKEGQYTLL